MRLRNVTKEVYRVLTTKGCCIFSRMFFSFSIWSTCLLLIISAFFIVFIAYLVALWFFGQPTLTLPKAPIMKDTRLFICLWLHLEASCNGYLPSPSEMPKTRSASTKSSLGIFLPSTIFYIIWDWNLSNSQINLSINHIIKLMNVINQFLNIIITQLKDL